MSAPALLADVVARLAPSAEALLTECTAGNDPTARWYVARGFEEVSRDARPGGLDVVWMRLPLHAA